MTSQCSVALLESALAGNCPQSDEESLHRHLEECEACTTALGANGRRRSLVPGGGSAC